MTRCGHDEMWARRGLVGVFQWFTLMHSQRGHAHHGTSGMGHVYQGRFKSFPIAADEHLFAAMRLLRSCIARGRPFGNEKWTKKVAMQLHLESTLRPRGRPRKAPADETSAG